MPVRKADVYPCMICDKFPCECNKKPDKKAVRTPRKTREVVNVESPLTTSPPSTPAPQVDIRSAMKAKASDSSATVITSPRVITKEAFDGELREAIRALWPILHPEERTKYGKQFATTDRVEAWKEKIRNANS